MNLTELIQLRINYKKRLNDATESNYLSVFKDILSDIGSKVKDGTLTEGQGKELARSLLNIALESFSGLESLNESIEKGQYQISFDANDSIASMVAALKEPKK